jgi:hypothetical protein
MQETNKQGDFTSLQSSAYCMAQQQPENSVEAPLFGQELIAMKTAMKTAI